MRKRSVMSVVYQYRGRDAQFRRPPTRDSAVGSGSCDNTFLFFQSSPWFSSSSSDPRRRTLPDEPAWAWGPKQRRQHRRRHVRLRRGVFHLDALLGARLTKNQTDLAVAGRFFFPLHHAQAADFSMAPASVSSTPSTTRTHPPTEAIPTTRFTWKAPSRFGRSRFERCPIRVGRARHRHRQRQQHRSHRRSGGRCIGNHVLLLLIRLRLRRVGLS